MLNECREQVESQVLVLQNVCVLRRYIKAKESKWEGCLFQRDIAGSSSSKFCDPVSEMKHFKGFCVVCEMG